MTDAFISYSRKDKVFARRLCEALGALQRDTWVDWEGIPYSSEWWAEIQAGIETAETFIFIASPDSLTSRVCHEELGYARRLNKRVIPVIRRTVREAELVQAWESQPWEQQAQENWQALGRINWLFFRRRSDCECQYLDDEIVDPACDGQECDRDDFEAAFRALVETVDTDLDHVKAHTRLLVRALEWQRNNRNASFLLRGDDLEDSESWLTQAVNKQPRATDLHAGYIAASRRAEGRRQRNVLVGVASGLVVTLVLAALAFFLFQQSQANLQVANARGTGVAQQASTATFAQGQAQLSANTAVAEADNRATQQRLAELNAATAIAAVATSERTAAEARSLLWANDARQNFTDGDPLSALALAVVANRIPNPPPLAQTTLSNIAYNAGIRRVFRGHSDRITTVAYSGDGRTALTGSADHTAVLWDLETGDIIHQWSEHEQPVTAVAFVDDARVLSADSSGRILLWDIATGNEIRRFEGHQGEIYALAVNAEGTLALSGGDDYQAILWDVDTGEAIHHLRGHTHFVSSVAFSPDGQMVATASYDTSVALWDANTGEQLNRLTAEDLATPVNSVAFSPDGNTLLVGSADPLLILWDVVRGDEVRRFAGHEQRIEEVAFSPDGRLAVSVSGSELTGVNEVILWNTATGEEVRRFAGHTGAVLAVAFSPDGEHFLTGSRDETLTLWDVYSGAVERRLIGHTDWVWDASFSPDGEHIVSVSSDRAGTSELMQWDVDRGRAVWRRGGLTGRLEAVAYSPDGETVISSYCGLGDFLQCVVNGGVAFYDAGSGDSRELFYGHAGDVYDVAFSPDGSRILSASYDDFVVIWDVASGEPLTGFRGHDEVIRSAAFSPDGSQVLSTSGNEFSGEHDLILWNVTTGREIRRFEGHADIIHDLEFSPDGSQALTASADSTIILWDIQTGTPIRRFAGHTDEVTGVTFSPDGTTAASGSYDGVVILWDVASGAELRRYTGHTDAVTSVDFSPDGLRLVSASRDATLLIWRVDGIEEMIAWTLANRPVRDFTCDERRDYQIAPLCGDNAVVAATPSLEPATESAIVRLNNAVG